MILPRGTIINKMEDKLMYLISCLLIFLDATFSFNKSSLHIPKAFDKASNVYPLGVIPASIL